jgi:hypothetical protein
LTRSSAMDFRLGNDLFSALFRYGFQGGPLGLFWNDRRVSGACKLEHVR